MGTRVLVVDDEAAITSMLKVVFETHGYEVRTAGSAAQGVRALASSPADVVLTDMKMESDTAGYEVVRAAHAQPNRPVILILTAYPLLAQQWRDAGADAVIPKPTQIAGLLDQIERLVAARKRALQKS